MNIPARCDVVVIGGGPAGAIAGTLLTKKGYDVVLLEKKKHPRYMVGESLTPHFWKYCDLAGASQKLEADGFVAKAGGTVIWNGVIRQLRFKEFGFTRPAMHVERDRFDHILLQNARERGVRVFEEVTAWKVDLDGDAESTVAYRHVNEEAAGTIACRFVVDASGQSAVIAKQLGLRVIDEGFRFMSVWGYFDDSMYVAADGQAHPFDHLKSVPPTTFISSIAGMGDWGWVWHIPLRDTTSVGLVLPLDEMKAVKASDEGWQAYLLRKCYEIPYLDRLLERAHFREDSVHVIRDYSYRPTRLAGPGFFLAGDAAAFVDPISSIGVALAMYSGYMAAWAIDRSFRLPEQSGHAQSVYDKLYRGRLEVARSLALPRYSASGNASDLAKLAIHFDSGIEQELMFVVSVVWSRNENFNEMAQKRDGQPIVSDRFKVLQEITF